MPPKRDEAALQEEEELQLAIALSQSEAEEKERMVGYTAEFTLLIFFSLITERNSHNAFCLLQRQKNSYSVYPKTDPTPVTSSAPPVSTLYTSPVVRALCEQINYLHHQTYFIQAEFNGLFKFCVRRF